VKKFDLLTKLPWDGIRSSVSKAQLVILTSVVLLFCSLSLFEPICGFLSLFLSFDLDFYFVLHPALRMVWI